MTTIPERDYVELRSEDVQEILGTPPGSLVRWGTLVVCVAFAVLLMVGWVISYPDVIEAKVVVTTSVPPVEVVARTDGHIAKLYARDKMPVNQNAVLAVLQSTANYDHIKELDAEVTRWLAKDPDALPAADKLTNNWEIGDLQTDYSAFIQNLENYQFGKGLKSASVGRSISSINQQIDKLNKSIQLDQNSMNRVNDQLTTARERYRSQRKLFDDGLISQMELEKEHQKLDDVETQHDQLQDNIFRKQREISSLGKNKNDESFSKTEDQTTTVSRLRQSLNSLRASLDKWKQTYLLTAPIDGRVSLNSTFFSEQQYVKQGEQVLSIVPPESDKIIGRLSLPVAGSGKVKPGQRVILKLDSYPYYEFGTLKGLVISKSLVPKDNEYAILVSLPYGLHTSYNRAIPFEQQLQGKAEIVTDEKRFLERIYEQVFAARH